MVSSRVLDFLDVRFRRGLELFGEMDASLSWLETTGRLFLSLSALRIFLSLLALRRAVPRLLGDMFDRSAPPRVVGHLFDLSEASFIVLVLRELIMPVLRELLIIFDLSDADIDVLVLRVLLDVIDLSDASIESVLRVLLDVTDLSDATLCMSCLLPSFSFFIFPLTFLLL